MYQWKWKDNSSLTVNKDQMQEMEMKVESPLIENTCQMQIKVKYLADILPIEIKPGSDWIDLRCAVRMELKAGEYAQIPLGVAMQLPDGYEAHVVPRSSTFKRFGVLLANGVGIIDNAYAGPKDQWHFLAYPTRDVVIDKNERICQFRIVKNQPELKLEAVDDLDGPSRGGIGSTGGV